VEGRARLELFKDGDRGWGQDHDHQHEEDAQNHREEQLYGELHRLFFGVLRPLQA